jgi:hypothetical protein
MAAKLFLDSVFSSVGPQTSVPADHAAFVAIWLLLHSVWADSYLVKSHHRVTTRRVAATRIESV